MLILETYTDTITVAFITVGVFVVILSIIISLSALFHTLSFINKNDDILFSFRGLFSSG